ncbi:MAG: DoxX family membrane protein [Deltaproteobacteria bacterium]
MKIATHSARYLLGLVFLVFGLNGFFNFLTPPPMPPAAGEFIGALVKTGYLMTLVKLTEVVCGALLLSGFLVPLALVLLSPVIVNIALFHVCLVPPQEGVMQFVFVAMHVFLMWQYRAYYKGLFTLKATIA